MGGLFGGGGGDSAPPQPQRSPKGVRITKIAEAPGSTILTRGGGDFPRVQDEEYARRGKLGTYGGQ